MILQRSPLRSCVTVLASVAFQAAFAAGVRAQTGVDTDRAALEAFYDATGGASWTNNTNWKTDAPLGEWHGVTTDVAGRVTNLRLTRRNGLAGQIPREIGNLANLRSLTLGGNNLSGPIPKELGNLNNLSYLSLGGANLSGPIPKELGNLNNLSHLSLGGNNLSGPIPKELGNLNNLFHLNLGRNNLSGPIPDDLGNMTKLRDLRLYENNLSGPIPDDLGNLASLAMLQLYENNLSGPIPDQLGELENLWQLYLWENNLSGPIPDDLGELENLVFLRLEKNNLSGSAPGSLGDLFRLRRLHLSSNPELTGPLPAEWIRLEALELLDIGNTNMCAPADDAFQAWVEGLDVFNGEDCPAVANRAPVPGRALAAMSIAVGASNSVDVSGSFSDPDGDVLTYAATSSAPAVASVAPPSGSTVTVTAVAEGTATVTVTAADPGGLDASQSFAVTVSRPASVDRAALEAFYNATGGANWTSSDNWMSNEPLGEWHGVTTDAAGRVTHLVFNDIRGNGVVGYIPRELGSLAKLRELRLGGAMWRDPIPKELGGLANLETLDLSGGGAHASDTQFLENSADLEGVEIILYEGLSGGIPEELGNLRNLKILNLSDNDLSGSAPARLGDLARLESLFLHSNPELTGLLPVEWIKLSALKVLNIWDTGLCAPADAEFQEWLRELDFRDGCGSGPNREPEAVGRPAPVTIALGASRSLDVSGWFSDPDGDVLTYEAFYLGTDVVSVAPPSGSTVTVTAISAGTAPVTVTATDPGGLSAEQTVTVTVTTAAAVDRAALTVLYDATGGANWMNSTNWKTEAALNAWHGVTTDAAGRVTRLELGQNNLSGAIPDDLGNLANLESLQLYGNALTGSAPARLGDLARLRELLLHLNPALTGPLPGGWTRLSALEVLNIELTGMCAPTDDAFQAWLRRLAFKGDECPDRAALEALYDVTGGASWTNSDNWKTAAALDDWHGVTTDAAGRVTRLELGQNNLSGAIPDDLGNLANLESLQLYGNALTGSAPARLGDLARLRELLLHLNPALTGPLPGGWTRLSALEVLNIELTGMCAPADEAFQDWLEGINFKGDNCPAVANRRPEAVPGRALAAMSISVGASNSVDVSGSFSDPDGDVLTYAATSSAPAVASVAPPSGSTVTVTAVSAGTATVTVTATDPDGLDASQSFAVTVRPPFTDDLVRPGVTPVKAVHFTELRTRIDGLRQAARLTPFGWTDPVLRAGVTRVKLVHLTELRRAIEDVYRAAGRTPQPWTDAAPTAGTTPIRAVHLRELRAAVRALE